MAASRSRKAQAITIDFAMSLFIFVVALVAGFSIFINTFPDTDYDRTRRNAHVAASILMSDGNPSSWTTDTVIRAGLLSDDHLSLRKYNELGELNRTALRTALRLDTEYMYIYITNSTGDIISLRNTSCGIGDLTVAGTQYTRPLRGAQLDTTFTLNTTQYDSTNYSALINNINTYDILILTQTLENETLASDALNDTAIRTKTVVLVGTTNTNAYGENATNATATDITFIHTDPFLGNITNGSSWNVSDVMYLEPLPPGATVLAESDAGDPVIASWLYKDTTVYYYGVTNGTQGNETLWEQLNYGIEQELRPSYLTCQTPTPPGSAAHINEQERVTVLHDDPVTIHLLMWVNQ
ncbi:MAG: hypothetical protein OXR66_00390 [Candidatus Woesearchaeota archaeon]|nr:hypothetical protein [Candidatus Woesearchaeota archaeon]